MHEVSIAQSIVDTIEAELVEDEYKNVREVHVKIGKLSGIEHKLLENVFQYVIDGSPFSNCSLHTALVEILVECEQCNKNFTIKNYLFVCPDCNTPSSKIIEGNELTIYKIIMEEPSYAEADQ